jgi:phytoene dehydrogenase-like protein
MEPNHRDSAQTVESELEGLLDLIQPGWRGVIVHRRFLPDMIVMNALPLASSGGTQGRPGPEVPAVPGLFVAGDWVGEEGLLVDAALASAKQAATKIIEGAATHIAAVA